MNGEAIKVAKVVVMRKGKRALNRSFIICFSILVHSSIWFCLSEFSFATNGEL